MWSNAKDTAKALGISVKTLKKMADRQMLSKRAVSENADGSLRRFDIEIIERDRMNNYARRLAEA